MGEQPKNRPRFPEKAPGGEQQRGDEKKQQRKPYGLLIFLKPLFGLAM